MSELESWWRGPTRTSGLAMVKALDRASDLEGLGVREVDCSVVPANRMLALAKTTAGRRTLSPAVSESRKGRISGDDR